MQNLIIICKKLIKFGVLRFGLIIFILIFFTSCQHSPPHSYQLTVDEQSALKTFFSTFLFEEGGAYTLFGEKPITFDVITDAKEMGIDDKPCVTDENWRQVKGRFKTPLYLLIERPSPLTEGRAVFLINIAATTLILKKHYWDFKSFVGDFDPFQIVFEIENEQSIFWKSVLSNEYLLGILLGFGESNAWLFQHCKNVEGEGKIQEFASTLFQKTPSSNAAAKTKEDILFLLPCFGCFTPDTQLLKQYEEDRERIKNRYKNRDFLEVTLDRLTSKDLPENPDKKFKELYLEVYKDYFFEGG